MTLRHSLNRKRKGVRDMKRMKPKWRENLMRREKTPLHIDNVAGNIVRSTGGEKDSLILNVFQNLTKKP